MLNKRASRTVKTKKKTYNYNYRVNSDGQFIQLSGKGYQANPKTNKLVYKSGKLTKLGEKYVESIQNSDKSLVEKNYLMKEFKKYSEIRREQSKPMTVESFNSHLKSNRITRMIYNFGSSPEEIAQITGASIADITDEANWDFESNTFMNGWMFRFDYEEYNGYQFTRI